MTASKGLTGELRRQVTLLEPDLRVRVESQPDVLGSWRAEHDAARKRERTAATWASWRDERVTQAAVAWVLTTVFVRFCEDNGLVRPVWIGGPEQRRQEALDAQRQYFREHALDTDREWIEQAIIYLAGMPATRDLVDERSAMHWVSPSGDAAAALLGFWRERDETGLLRDLTDPELSTRFLGDIYQDISASARATYALLQTPVFVEEFILDRTMEPALAERSLEGFKLIDPTCGSGHFLLGAFSRLLTRWQIRLPGLDAQTLVQRALDAVHGVDVNPFAIAITRFRLTIAALQASAITRLEVAPAFDYHLAVGDSLWFGAVQQTLDYGADHDDESALVGFAYSFEDRVLLRKLLQPGRYDAVVGNPPYITVKDKALNAAYRSLYSTCKGTYAMTVPFMELFFKLAVRGSDGRRAGWVGQITSNSFMKREFGAPLIEKFLVRLDLRNVIDTSGAYIPGHGTPTVIIIGRNQSPIGPTVRAVLGIRGEPGRPDDPTKGIVWLSITKNLDCPGSDDGWTSSTDLERRLLSRHPWNLRGGGAVQLAETIANSTTRGVLGDEATRIGFFGDSHMDEAFFLERSFVNRLHVSPGFALAAARGASVRDWIAGNSDVAIFPYDSQHSLVELEKVGILPTRYFWTLRTLLGARSTFGGGTYLSDGRPWYEWHQLPKDSKASIASIGFASIATHNHFALDRDGKVFNRSAPIIKLPEGATDNDHLALIGILNSSTACFWLKQKSHNKGRPGAESGGADEPWEHRFEFTGTTLQEYPIPSVLPLERARTIELLANDLARTTADFIVRSQTPSRLLLDSARARYQDLHSTIIATQEELDWDVYRMYGIIPEDMTYSGEKLPKIASAERAFAITLARDTENGTTTSWFRHWNHRFTPVSKIPTSWPIDYQRLVQKRLDVMQSNLFICLLEKPEYKRRWTSEPWEMEEENALRDWLLDRLEDDRFWFDPKGRPTPMSIAQLADIVARDSELAGVLALWDRRPDLPVTESLTRLLGDESVPFLSAYRYHSSGLQKRADWEETWDLQRLQDAGKDVGSIPVPPKYLPKDFVKTSYWQARGKLDVPKERFACYPNAGRDTDPTMVIGWAGWDHAQQALALNLLIEQRQQDGWDDERVVPLVAGLAELQPWVDQWHNEIDPAYGFSLASFCREELTRRAAQVGRTLDQLRQWRPPQTSARRGRKPKITGATS